MNKKTVRDVDLKGKRVLMRVDFNVPMTDGAVTDDKRIKAALPTIQYVLEQGASLILMSHLGRPKGTGFDPEFSLKAAAEALGKLLGKPVKMAPDCVGPEVEAHGEGARSPATCCCWRTSASTRKRRRTISTSPSSWRRWATCTSTTRSARRTARTPRTEGVARYLPAVSGFLMEQELEYLGRATANPDASVRGHPGRRQDQRQDPGRREPAEPSATS